MEPIHSQIKKHIENMTCSTHMKRPDITITDSGEFAYSACCEEFGNKLSMAVDDKMNNLDLGLDKLFKH